MRLAVIDTNVVVSGVLTGSGDSPSRRIVLEMLRGRLRFVLSEPLLSEYRRVLLRPKIVERHGLAVEDVDRFLTGLVVNATMREPSIAPEPGPAVRGDEHLVALLRGAPESVLVTGDKRLAETVETWCRVATPAEFEAGPP